MIIYGEYEGRDRGTEVGAVIDATLVKRASSGSEGSGYVMHRGNGSYVLPANKMGPPRWFFFARFRDAAHVRGRCCLFRSACPAPLRLRTISRRPRSLLDRAPVRLCPHRVTLAFYVVTPSVTLPVFLSRRTPRRIHRPPRLSPPPSHIFRAHLLPVPLLRCPLLPLSEISRRRL